MVFRVFFLIVFFFLNNVYVEKYGSFKSFGYIYIYIYVYIDMVQQLIGTMLFSILPK